MTGCFSSLSHCSLSVVGKPSDLGQPSTSPNVSAAWGGGKGSLQGAVPKALGLATPGCAAVALPSPQRPLRRWAASLYGAASELPLLHLSVQQWPSDTRRAPAERAGALRETLCSPGLLASFQAPTAAFWIRDRPLCFKVLQIFIML